MKSHKGSVTVMLILVLCSVIMAVTLVVEVARIRIAEGQAKRAVDTAIFSALAAYDQDTKDGYGLFYRYGTDELEEEIRSVVEKTLLINDGSSAWQPYEYEMTAMEIRVLFPLSDPESMRHQILEYMKYRAPKTLVGDSAEKLSAFFCMKSTAGVMKADLSVDLKIKKIADTIQKLEHLVIKISQYSDADLIDSNLRAAGVSEKASHIRTLEAQLARLRSEGGERTGEDRGNMGNLKEQLEFARAEMDEAGRTILEELLPVLEYNRQALESCRELKRLGPETERAIRESEVIMSNKKNVMEDIEDALNEKYADYRQYINLENLTAMESDLEINIRLIESKVELLQDILTGKTYGIRPSVFETRGYRMITLTSRKFPGSKATPTGVAVNVTPEVIQKLVSTAQNYWEEIQHTATTKDNGPIRNCPGTRFEDVPEDLGAASGDSYERANASLDNAYDLVGRNVDADSFIESIAGGTIKVSQDTYETLLVNEYVLEVFNNRESGGRGKRALDETEVEYVLIGSAVPKVNAAASQLEIVAWRTAFNAVSFGYYCPEIGRSIDGVAMSLNGLTGVPYPVWKAALTGVLSLIESIADTKRMLCSETIPLFKFKTDEISIMRELQDLVSELGVGASPVGERETSEKTTPSNREKKIPAKNLEVNYKDHLRAMLMYRSLLGQNERTLRRIQDLIYTNTLKSRENYDPTKHFNFIEVDAQFTIKSFFPNISAANTHIDGIPIRHILTVECGRGY